MQKQIKKEKKKVPLILNKEIKKTTEIGTFLRDQSFNTNMHFIGTVIPLYSFIAQK